MSPGTEGRDAEAQATPGGRSEDTARPDRRRTPRWVVLAAVVAVVIASIAAFWWARHRAETPDQARPSPSPTQTTGPSPSGSITATLPPDASAARPGEVPVVTPVTCPEATVRVSTSSELRAALSAAAPGTVIGLADGTYQGKFTGSARGEQDKPIWVCGGPGAVLDAGSVESGYGFHVDRGSYWRLVGFTVRNAQKGVMVDASDHLVVQGLIVREIGDEGIHLRRATTDSVVAGNTIAQTGKRKPQFGEGVYVGTAKSNWCDISGCAPDRSDRNVVAGNRISETTAESVDIKEGTISGFVVDNEFDGRGIVDTETTVNVKGNAWRISGNKVADPPKDAFQTHEILAGWGTHNLFENNKVVSGGRGGYVVGLTPALENVVRCSNEAADGMQVSKKGCS